MGPCLYILFRNHLFKVFLGPPLDKTEKRTEQNNLKREAQRADVLNDLSIRQSNVGQLEAALESSRQAELLYRQLAEKSNEVDLPALSR